MANTKKDKAENNENFSLWDAFDYSELDHIDRLDWLCMKKGRTIMFNGEVTEELCDYTTKELIVLASMSKDPILIIINTIGGSHFDGLLLIDTMEDMKRRGIEIITEVRGSAYSMGLDILVAGSYRIGNTYSRYLLHEVSDSMGEMKDSNIQEYAKEVHDVNMMLAKRMAMCSDLSVSEIHELMDRKDYFFGSKEALQYGFIDKTRRRSPRKKKE